MHIANFAMVDDKDCELLSKETAMRLYIRKCILVAAVSTMFIIGKLLLELNDVHPFEPLLLRHSTPLKGKAELHALSFNPRMADAVELWTPEQNIAASQKALYRKLISLHTLEPNQYMEFSRQLSPDARWLLLHRFHHGVGDEEAEKDTPLRHRVEIISIDGTRDFVFHLERFDSSAFWLADSHRWAEVARDRVIYRSLDNHANDISVPHVMQFASGSPEQPIEVGQVEIGRFGDHVIVPCSLPVPDALPPSFHSDSTNWNMTDYQWKTPDLRWCILDLQANPVTARPILSVLPAETRVEQVTPSPDGSKIALECVTRRHYPLLSLLVPLFPALRHSEERLSGSLWICQTDGSRLHAVGYMSRSLGDMRSIRWSEDGSKLLFTVSSNSNAGRPVETAWKVDAP